MKAKLKPIVVAMISSAAFGLGSAVAAGSAGDQAGKSTSRASTQASGSTSAERGTSTQLRQAMPLFATIVVIDEPQFGRLDKDRDGRLSREEVDAAGRLQQNWADVDRNNDGYMTREELYSYNREVDRQAGRAAAGPPDGTTSLGIDPSSAATGARQSTDAASSTAARTLEGPPQGTTTYGIDPSKAESSGYAPARPGAARAQIDSSHSRIDAASVQRADGPPSGQTSYGMDAARDRDAASAQPDRSAADNTVGMEQGAARGRIPVVTTVLVINEPELMRLDTDRDNRLSKEEVRTVSRFQEVWPSVDRDLDGYLTKAEISDYNRQLVPGTDTGAANAAPKRVLQGPPSGSNTYGIDPPLNSGESSSAGSSGRR